MRMNSPVTKLREMGFKISKKLSNELAKPSWWYKPIKFVHHPYKIKYYILWLWFVVVTSHEIALIPDWQKNLLTNLGFCHSHPLAPPSGQIYLITLKFMCNRWHYDYNLHITQHYLGQQTLWPTANWIKIQYIIMNNHHEN